jgi:putative ABC transport system substrate-binding protein
MRRRDFIALLGGTAAVLPLAARAQDSGRMRRIGALLNGAADDPFYQVRMKTFMQGLQQFGWIDGRNIHIEVR